MRRCPKSTHGIRRWRNLVKEICSRLSTTGTRGAKVATCYDRTKRVLEVVIEYRVDEWIDTRRQVTEPRKRDKHRLGYIATGALAAEHIRRAAVRGGSRFWNDSEHRHRRRCYRRESRRVLRRRGAVVVMSSAADSVREVGAEERQPECDEDDEHPDERSTGATLASVHLADCDTIASDSRASYVVSRHATTRAGVYSQVVGFGRVLNWLLV